MKTVTLADGKYEVDLADTGTMLAMRRNGENWETGFEQFRFAGVFMSAMWRIVELEESQNNPGVPRQ
jgi:hypothetical protein